MPWRKLRLKVEGLGILSFTQEEGQALGMRPRTTSRLQGLLESMEQRPRKVGTLPLQEANRQTILPAKVTLNHVLQVDFNSDLSSSRDK